MNFSQKRSTIGSRQIVSMYAAAKTLSLHGIIAYPQ